MRATRPVPPSARAVLYAAPGVLLALTGLFHPAVLTYPTSGRWTVVHAIGLFLVPLVGVALAEMVWNDRSPLARTVVLGSFVYATGYTALDALEGVGAGYVTYRLGPGAARSPAVDYLVDIGNALGSLGVLGLLAATIAMAALAGRRGGMRALAPAALLVVASLSFLDSHFDPWRGVLTVLAIGIATGWLALIVVPRDLG
ncbi:MAG: hypothetical protein HOQ22_14920 [Nocardioidaceae bacterium]|nr:hypothetical protein [Nocardioidaceae bacterium]NUS52319.1 hypothetical protein [Nocardioidaceae bacterium]